MKESLNSGHPPARKPVVLILMVLLIGGIGALVVAYLRHQPPGSTVASAEPEEPVPAPEPETPKPEQAAVPTLPVRATASAVARVAPTPPALDPAVSPYTRQIVT